MGLYERAIISLVKSKLSHDLKLNEIQTIPSDGIKEYDIKAMSWKSISTVRYRLVLFCVTR